MGDPRIDWTKMPEYFRVCLQKISFGTWLLIQEQTFYISIVLYNASLTGIKLTFLLQYYRVLSTQRMRKVIIWALVFVSMWSISQLLIVIFTCTPIEAFWRSELITEGKGKCIPNLPFWYINAAGNIVTDV